MLCSGRTGAIFGWKLPLLDGMHGFNASDESSCAIEGFETEHGSGTSLDGAVILLDEVVQIFGLAQFNIKPVFCLEAMYRCGIGTALVDGDLFWGFVQPDGSVKEAASRSENLKAHLHNPDYCHHPQALVQQTSLRVLICATLAADKGCSTLIA